MLISLPLIETVKTKKETVLITVDGNNHEAEELMAVTQDELKE